MLQGLWVCGVAVKLVEGVRRWRFTTGLIARSEPASEEATRIATEVAATIGLRRTPSIRVSEEVSTPLVAGALRPVVVVPADRFAALSADEQRMALCHELAHVKRADLWLGCVPALAERVFFFHPLVRLAAREYALCREAACDAAVIDALATSPREYARLLLALGVSPGRMTAAAAGASWSFSTLKRRITMLGEPSTRSWTGRAIAATVITAAIAAIVPLRLSARPQAAAMPALTPERTIAEVLATPSDGKQQKEREINYVLFLDDHHTNMSGSTRDIELARRHRRTGERLLWFRQAGREYVVRDASVIDQVVNLWAPVNVIGDEQGKVGARQGEIGARQGEIGQRQGRVGSEQGVIGAKQGTIGDRQGRLAAREASARTDEERRSIDAEHRRLDEDMRALDRQMQELDAKMRDLDKPMRDLDDQMKVLDREMQALDVKMRDAVKRAETEMLTLMDKSIASGAAVSVK